MSGTFSVAPPWAETTFDWIRQFHPHLLGARGDLNKKLEAALVKANYCLKEAADEPKRQIRVVASLVRNNWDEESHQDFRKFMEDGGYTPAPAVPKAAAAANPATGLPPFEIQHMDGTVERVDLEMPEDATPSEELRDDPRLGSW